ncbi:leukemia inhibitory factor receptor-like [Paramormyrops kingsleyae]|uniref:leukemia inhibitory factor receptor-like n=1 Tax=Paramormyrops kingsleyae TaxID=1676925 RepID=UPI003B96A17A
MCSRLLWVLCVLLQVLGHVCLIGQELPVPYELKVNAAGWSLSLTWKSHLYSKTLLYEVQVLQEDNSVPVHHEVLRNTVNQDAMSQTFTVHHWEWISYLPLNCISHSVRIRSQFESQTSQWRAITVTDTPEERNVYPTDSVVLVGSQVSFCCVVQKEDLISFNFEHLKNETWIRKNVAVIDVQYLNATRRSGNNIHCKTSQGTIGSTVFVGYPPDDHDLQCQTDLQSVTCFWNIGRITDLFGLRKTIYTLNGSKCTKSNQCNLRGHPPSGESTWTLVAENPLGRVVLNQTVDLSHRVVLQAPQQLKILERTSRNASVSWNWNMSMDVNFGVQCEVHLNCIKDDRGDRPLPTSPPPRRYSGVGLSRLLLEDLLPDTMYELKMHCGKLENFWNWSSCSSTSFRTTEYYPDTPDLWVQRDSNNTLYVMWKPLSWSNGWLTEYKVTWKNLTDGMEQTRKVEPSYHTTDINLGEHSPHHTVMVTVTASNSVGSSSPAVIIVPGGLGDHMLAISRVTGTDGGFELSWSPHNGTTCGYVVEWHPADIKKDVEWLKVPAGQTHARIESASFVAGKKYNLTIYNCQASLELLERKEGYIQELVPAAPVQDLTVTTKRTDTVLSWGRIPPQSHRGFIRGYIIRCDSPDVKEVNITDPDALEYRFLGLLPNTYKFTVTAYTQIGEGAPKEVSINIPIDAHKVLMMIFITIAFISFFLIIVTIVCYRYRRWLKFMFHSEVPKPKITSEWTTEKGALLMVTKPCIHDQLHIVEKQDKTAKLKLNREMSFPEEGQYAPLQFLESYMLGLSDQLRARSTHSPESLPSSLAQSSKSPGSNEVTYTKIQNFLEVSPYRPEPQMKAPYLEILPTLPKTMDSYFPQSASQEDRPPAEDHLTRPVCTSSSPSSHPNLSSHSAPSPCCAISNPTYCPTLTTLKTEKMIKMTDRIDSMSV